MNKRLARLAAGVWYGKNVLAVLLWPLSKVFEVVVWLRRACYRLGICHATRIPVPVIVVGNITVGGAGKTPLIIWLARFLQQQGYRPGIVSRGYGGRAQAWPQRVTPASSASEVGDEALLIAAKTGCPVAVSPRRGAACRLLADDGCDVLLSDDGLQHYALARTLEIAVIDGERRFGNGWCLPAGPLREPVARLQEVDFRVVNGGRAGPHAFAMRMTGREAVNLLTGEKRPLHAFNGGICHALAGIGHPARFFKFLADAGLDCVAHDFPDHFVFRRKDLDFGDGLPVLMTEKDAVKCRAFAGENLWAVPVAAELDDAFSARLLESLSEKHDR